MGFKGLRLPRHFNEAVQTLRQAESNARLLLLLCFTVFYNLSTPKILNPKIDLNPKPS